MQSRYLFAKIDVSTGLTGGALICQSLPQHICMTMLRAHIAFTLTTSAKRIGGMKSAHS